MFPMTLRQMALPKHFSVTAVTTSNTPDEKEPAIGFAVIPYIQGVTEPMKKILNSYNVKIAQKPFQTLGQIFGQDFRRTAYFIMYTILG